jgi:hypothetical protein
MMSPTVVGLRRKAGSVLQHLLKQVGEPALRFCPELEAMAQDLFAKGQATNTEMAMLHEAMLGAVAARGLPAMLEFSTNVLAQPLQASHHTIWRLVFVHAWILSIQPLQVLDSMQGPLNGAPGSFLAMLGITQGGTEGPQSVQARSGVYGALRHLWVMCRTHVEVYDHIWTYREGIFGSCAAHMSRYITIYGHIGRASLGHVPHTCRGILPYMDI